MRPILAVSVATCILGIVGLYSWFQHTLPASVSNTQLKRIAAPGSYAVEVTLTFDAVADDFSLEPTSLILRMDGGGASRTLINEKNPVTAGQPIVLSNVGGIRLGVNEFYLEAYDGDSFSDAWRCARVRILRDDTPLAEESLWGANGVIQESFAITIAPNLNAHGHDHDGDEAAAKSGDQRALGPSE